MSTEAIFVVHAYQPPTPIIQIPEVLKRITQRTYLPFAKAMSELEGAKVVLNMNGCLTKMLQEESPEVISFLNKAIERGVLELVDSGMFHPILPFCEGDKDEFEAHILANRETNSKAFSLQAQPLGFWPPELAVSTIAVKRLVDMGYKAIMCPANILKERKRRTLYGIKSGKNKALLLSRDKEISNAFSFRRYNDDAGRIANDICGTANWIGAPIVLACDLETLNEHHANYMPVFFKLLSQKSLHWVGLTDLIDGEYHVEYVDEICPTSWSTEDADRDRSIGYPLWDHPQNVIHGIQKSHMNFLRTCLKLTGGINSLGLTEKMDYMIACISCYSWWANNGYCWSPDMVRKGFEAQMKSLKGIVASFEKSQRKAFLEYSELLYGQIKEAIRTR